MRDLESRNGTMVGSETIKEDRPLDPGDIVRIAHTQMAYVHNLSTAFADLEKPPPATDQGDETSIGPLTANWEDPQSLELREPTLITHRRGRTRFLERAEGDDDISVPRVGRAAKELCRLAFELANQPEAVSASRLALAGLMENTNADAAGVFLRPSGSQGKSAGNALELMASQTRGESPYHHVSKFLTDTVLREGEAVLARNVENDSTLGLRDSRGEILATSVICAPIRQDSRVVGLIHLYATDTRRPLDPDDLEFTLALAENLALALKNLQRQQELAENLNQSNSEIVQLRERLGDESELVGSSELMMKVQQEVLRAAPSRATVLIRGESGVGKELVARAVHFASARKSGPLKCLNCAALTESLLESELFGHERGAFTGATERKHGKFEAAHKGTLVLDEIGEMSPSIQAKFLRVLEGHPFERVGGSKAIQVDTRVIASTNRNLEKAVAEGRFRRDLFFRLNVVEIVVPPLRRRPQDILDLSKHFLEKFNAETGRRFKSFTPEALKRLQQYRWPGNVRELKNVVERAVVLGRSEYIDVDDLALTNLATAGDSAEISLTPPAFEPLSLADMEARHIAATLQAFQWNKSKTSAVLGIERSTLDRKIRRYKIERPEGDA